jgi:hypothetical protein
MTIRFVPCLVVLLLAGLGAGCSDGTAPDPTASWEVVNAGPVSLALPPGFAAMDVRDGVGDLGEQISSILDRALFVARRGSLTDPVIDLIVVTAIPGSLSGAVPDLCKPLKSTGYTLLDARNTSLPIGTARRCVISETAPVPDEAHPRSTAITRFHIEIDGQSVTLAMVRLGDGSSVPEADLIAATMSTS